MKGKRSTSAKGEVSLQVGQPFNPFGLFHGIWIPEALLRAKGISPGAKLVYGRLTRYAGPDGDCYPAVPTLASEIALSVRQTQKYLAELAQNELIRRIPRIPEAGQTSNAYVFLWHPLFEKGVTHTAPEGVTHTAPEGVNDRSPKESHLQESQTEETTIDLDYPTTNRKNRDSRLDLDVELSNYNQYPRLREELADYMATADDPERAYPRDRQVVDVMDAAGASEEDVIRCLSYLKNERGLRPGTRHGPRHFSWFKTVVADYFQKKRDRQAVINPPGPGKDNGDVYGLSKEEFDSITEALD